MAKQTKRPLRRLSEEQRPYVGKDIAPPAERVQTAKLVKTGRSQAVRLPKEFRFEGDEVYVKRQGDSVLLTPKSPRKKGSWKDLLDALDSFDPKFRFERNQPPLQVRKSIEDLFAPRRPKSKRRK